MTACNGFERQNKNQRHSTPMSFFGADFCAASDNNAILNNTALSVLFFVFSLVCLLAVPVILRSLVLITVLILAVSIHILISKTEQAKQTYYSYKAE